MVRRGMVEEEDYTKRTESKDLGVSARLTSASGTGDDAAASPSPPEFSSSDSGNSSGGGGAIAAIVIPIVVLVLIVLIVIGAFKWRNRSLSAIERCKPRNTGATCDPLRQVIKDDMETGANGIKDISRLSTSQD